MDADKPFGIVRVLVKAHVQRDALVIVISKDNLVGEASTLDDTQFL
ncbi:MAG TPA: hypothetical protein PKE29_02310 [Phycisphaerales bacterium]|nr:hypothetical protein [Phycisphaerales bacterium]